MDQGVENGHPVCHGSVLKAKDDTGIHGPET